MRTSLIHFAASTIVAGSIIGLSAQEPQQQALSRSLEPALAQTAPAPVTSRIATETTNNPVADPKATVIIGNARFTVLTPELIRMEWAADRKFEDHASFVFINRHLPVPRFEATKSGTGDAQAVTIKTSALTLHYSASGDGKFTPDNLSIELTVDGKPVTWHPGTTDTENLQGKPAHSTAQSDPRHASRSNRVSYPAQDGRS